MKKRTGFQVMLSLIGLVKPLMGFMVLAIAMGLAGHLCAAFLTVLGGLWGGPCAGLADGSFPADALWRYDPSGCPSGILAVMGNRRATILLPLNYWP